MAKTASTMLPLGVSAPFFRLPDTQGRAIALDHFSDSNALLVIFLCNHCPYVIHIREALARFADEYQPRGLAVVGINANDAEHYPADGPEKMVQEAQMAGYHFPYLFDESQETAKAYHAACTPDLFLFDQQRHLVYRGQFDDSRPGNGIAATGMDLRRVADQLLAGHPIDGRQQPSLGCNIKWKPGNEPEYA